MPRKKKHTCKRCKDITFVYANKEHTLAKPCPDCNIYSKDYNKTAWDKALKIDPKRLKKWKENTLPVKLPEGFGKTSMPSNMCQHMRPVDMCPWCSGVSKDK